MPEQIEQVGISQEVSGIPYTSYAYLFPPRPESAIPASMLGYYAKKKWIGQYKKNGTCNVLTVRPDGKIICMNRHEEKHKAWVPGISLKPFEALESNWYVFVSEVLNNKVPGIRDTQYVFDLLVYKGTYLIGTTLAERLKLLQSMFMPVAETHSHYVITPNVWLAKEFSSGFARRFEEINQPEDEGLVLKDPNSKLELCLRGKNAGWSVKCRKLHKNFSF